MTTKTTATIIWILSIVRLLRAEVFRANFSWISTQEYACEYASQLSFKVMIPSNVTTSMFSKNLTLSLALPQGTTFANQNLKMFWEDRQAPIMSLGDSEFPIIQARIQLVAGKLNYNLAVIHTSSIIHSFSQGNKSISLRISPLDLADQILGQTWMDLAYRTGRSLMTKCS